jgi:hypothetical protein
MKHSTARLQVMKHNTAFLGEAVLPVLAAIVDAPTAATHPTLEFQGLADAYWGYRISHSNWSHPDMASYSVQTRSLSDLAVRPHPDCPPHCHLLPAWPSLSAPTSVDVLQCSICMLAVLQCLLCMRALLLLLLGAAGIAGVVPTPNIAGASTRHRRRSVLRTCMCPVPCHMPPVHCPHSMHTCSARIPFTVTA